MKYNCARKFIMGALCLLIVFTIIPRVKTVWELSQQKKELIQQKTELKEINERLKKKSQQLDSPEAIEKIAREQLGMIKKGEKVIIKVEPEGQQ